jgi:hypothetical protein
MRNSVSDYACEASAFMRNYHGTNRSYPQDNLVSWFR